MNRATTLRCWCRWVVKDMVVFIEVVISKCSNSCTNATPCYYYYSKLFLQNIQETHFFNEFRNASFEAFLLRSHHSKLWSEFEEWTEAFFAWVNFKMIYHRLTKLCTAFAQVSGTTSLACSHVITVTTEFNFYATDASLSWTVRLIHYLILKILHQVKGKTHLLVNLHRHWILSYLPSASTILFQKIERSLNMSSFAAVQLLL